MNSNRLRSDEVVPRPFKDFENREPPRPILKPAPASHEPRYEEFLGMTAVMASASMRRLISITGRVGRTASPVLISGESGTGKELIARAVHHFSPRPAGPFVNVNCAALPEYLMESELFGYEKGAFSGAEGLKPGLFETAAGGTLFLDEITELDSRMQAKLLRVLDGHSYFRLGGSRKVTDDVRMVAATSLNMEAAVQEGKFRIDLFHRLDAFHLRVPPLRERTEDIAPLAAWFLRDTGLSLRRPRSAFARKIRLARQCPRTQECPEQGGPVRLRPRDRAGRSADGDLSRPDRIPAGRIFARRAGTTDHLPGAGADRRPSAKSRGIAGHFAPHADPEAQSLSLAGPCEAAPPVRGRRPRQFAGFRNRKFAGFRNCMTAESIQTSGSPTPGLTRGDATPGETMHLLAPPAYLPRPPRTFDQLDIPENMLLDLTLRHVSLRGVATMCLLADLLKLSLDLTEAIFRRLNDQHCLDVQRSSGDDYVFSLSPSGRRLAAERANTSRYAGPAPVSLESWKTAVRAQVASVRATRDRLRAAFSDIVVSDPLLDALGPALISQRSIFLYGPSGTGKTTIAERLARAFEDAVVVPYAIEADGQIITMADPAVHEIVTFGDLDVDARWMVCRRPFVAVGGELMPAMLDLDRDDSTGTISAPLQMKANNGILLIDDLGRQRIPPRDLLNRWIVPPTGASISSRSAAPEVRNSVRASGRLLD